MKPETLRYTIYAQVCFYVGLLVCIVIRPAGLAANGGISYYGVYKDTIVFYCLALAGSGLLSIRAGLSIFSDLLKVLRIGLVAIGVFALGVLVTPDSLSSLVTGFHEGFGSALFVTQILISLWLFNKLARNFVILLLIILEFMAGIASYFYLAPAHGFLLQTQTIFQLAFSITLIYSLPKLMYKPN